MEFRFALKRRKKDIYGILSNGDTFDPTIVFGDMLQSADSVNLEEEFQHIFGNPFSEEDISECFERLVAIREKIIEARDFGEREFDGLRSYWGLTYEVDIVNIDNVNIPLKFGFCDIQEVLNGITGQEQCYIYRCHSMTDISFATWHYLLTNGYKFKRCEHCGKYFATKSLKTKYCPRKSPYKNYGHLTCAVAVDHLKKAIKKRERNICNYLGKYFPDALEPFRQEIKEVSASIPQNSVKYFECLESLMVTERVKKIWYTAQYK